MRKLAEQARHDGLSVVLVPTMGAFHAGHLALMEYARQLGGLVVVSLFVNPLQFGPQEDLSRYPRDPERDQALAASAGVDVVFAPGEADMYPEGDSETRVDMGEMAKVLCGAARPGHFNGVATVVAKLVNITAADVLVMGQKDGQQAAVIRRMVRDLNFPVRVDVRPTVRDAQGLALSSRNRYLDEAEVELAQNLYRSLKAAQTRFSAGERSTRALIGQVLRSLAQHAIAPEYVAMVDPDTLKPAPDPAGDGPWMLALAARIGPARLIDNVILSASLGT